MPVAQQPLCQVLSSFQPPQPHNDAGYLPPQPHNDAGPMLRAPPGLGSAQPYAAPPLSYGEPYRNDIFPDARDKVFHSNFQNRRAQQFSPFKHTDADPDEDLEWEQAVAEAFLGIDNKPYPINRSTHGQVGGYPGASVSPLYGQSASDGPRDNSVPALLGQNDVPQYQSLSFDPRQNTQPGWNGQTGPKSLTDRSKKVKPGRPNAQPLQWWRECSMEQLCPLSGFPICLLPYPPFKFRQDPNRPEHFELVDGKYLVLQAIASGRFEACGRPLLRSDVNALDTYIRRCNLGPLRPGCAADLQQAVATAPTREERAQAEQDLNKLRERARSEWKRLQRIQDQRMSELRKRNQGLPAGPLHAGLDENNGSMLLAPNRYPTKENHRNTGNMNSHIGMFNATY